MENSIETHKKRYKKYFVTFADKNLYLSLNRIQLQAKQMDCFDGGIFAYDEDDLDETFNSTFGLKNCINI